MVSPDLVRERQRVGCVLRNSGVCAPELDGFVVGWDRVLPPRDHADMPVLAPARGEKAGFLIRKHNHFTPTREIRRGTRALTARDPTGARRRCEYLGGGPVNYS